MLQSIEAEIGSDGHVRLRDPIQLQGRHRAIVTVLEALEETTPPRGSREAVLSLLDSPAFKNRPGYPVKEIESHVNEAHNSWD